MKFFYELMGNYERVDVQGEPVSGYSLEMLLSGIQDCARSLRCHQVKTLQKSFGFSFLPQRALPHLMEQYQGQSPQVTDTHIITFPKNTKSGFSGFKYKFKTQKFPENFTINLQQDDPQILNFRGTSCPGIYRYLIEENLNSHHPLFDIYSQAQQIWQKIFKSGERDLELLQNALRSPNPDEFSLELFPKCTVWLRPDELSPVLQEAIYGLLNQKAIKLPESQDLIEQYRQHQPNSKIDWGVIPSLSISEYSPQTELCCGRGLHRDLLQQLIEQAQEFLLISSYRLEDEAIIEAIVEKSKSIPVWLLTNFDSDVQDRVDTYSKQGEGMDSPYENSDHLKKRCLRRLLQGGVPFRSGPFHLKTYLSEQSAYLGSCNLTGGSLSRNPEVGYIWKQTSEHRFLIDLFRYLWNTKSKAKCLPISSGIGFHIETVEVIATPYPTPSSFLNFYEYRRDFTQVLQEFSHNPQGEVVIYTRNLNPTPEQLNLLSHLPTRIYYGYSNNTHLEAQLLDHLHGKVVVIGDRVAYVGSQDCAFSRHPLIDLTFKTTDPQVIEEIVNHLPHLHS